MPWQNNQGGGDDRGPWGQGPRQGGSTPLNLDDIIRKGQDRMKGFLPRGFGGGIGITIILLILGAFWLSTGMFRVQPSEQGVVLIFGKWDEKLLGEGFHITWPAPISEIFTPNVTEVRRTEIGFSTQDNRGRETAERNIDSESLMLTGDENIIDVDFEVFWQISDAGKYLFNIQDQLQTVKGVAESAMREAIGKTPLERALTKGRDDIAEETGVLMQAILDSYDSGVQVTQIQLRKADTPQQVIGAFRDVQAAGADREAAINEAQAYRNKIVPEARGEAAKIVQQAEGYRETVVARATGEASRFLAVLKEYKQAEDVTKRRIYLETMEQILKDVDKIIIDGNAGSGVVPYLPLPEIQKRRGGASQ
jgi:modulator of FtsH protease HflK